VSKRIWTNVLTDNNSEWRSLVFIELCPVDQKVPARFVSSQIDRVYDAAVDIANRETPEGTSPFVTEPTIRVTHFGGRMIILASEIGYQKPRKRPRPRRS